MNLSFDDQINLGLAQEMSGWDFTWLQSHIEEEPLPWDYEAMARALVAGSQAVLDVSTGGGELFSRLGPFPLVAWATEGYPPNVVVARTRLEPLGVQVADVSELSDLMPFINNTFDLVLNRHGNLYADEVERILEPGGRFFSQQVGSENCMDLNRALQESPYYIYASDTLDAMVEQIQTAGLEIIQTREYFPRMIFHDIAGVAFYLKAVPWQIKDFSFEKYREALLRVHQAILRDGGFAVRQHRILIEAVKKPESAGLFEV